MKPLTHSNKLVLGATAGFAAVLGGILLFSKKAAAATNPSNPTPSPSGISPTDGGRGQAAVALAAAIQSGGGYCGSQTTAVGQYQAQAGISVDGFPGSNTMTALNADLATMNVASTYPVVGTLTLYPWTLAGGWTSGNVPTSFVNNQAAWAAGTTCST